MNKEHSHPSVNEELVEVKMVLEIDFDTFIENQKEQFLDELAVVLSCSREQISDITFTAGCVIVRFKLPERLAVKLLKQFHNMISDDTDVELGPIKELVAKYSVEELVRTQNFDMFFTSKKKPTDKAVLFVHGWSGEKGSFGRMPDYISKACACPAYIYQYPTDIWKHSPSIVFIANALRNSILNILPDKKLAIIAHSMGGLIVRQLLTSESRTKSRLDLNVDNITFIASPHSGSAYATIADRIPLLGSQQIDDLKPNSPVLFQLNIDWAAWTKDYSTFCNINSIFGTADKVVAPSNAIGTAEEVVSILGRTHVDLVKPESADDQVVLTVLRFLRQSGFLALDGEEGVSKILHV